MHNHHQLILLQIHLHQLALEFTNNLHKKNNDKTLEPWEKVSAAIGASFYEEGDDMESLFKRADQNMYKTKEQMKKKK